MASKNGTADEATNGHAKTKPGSARFSDIPSAIDIPVQGDQEDEAVEIDLEILVDDPTELCTLFENEHAAKTYWMTVALAYAKQRKIDHAIEMLIRGGSAVQSSNPRDKVSMICCLCWMYLFKSREAPRIVPDGVRVSEAKTKEYYLQLATSSLNDAARLNPSYPPIFLARGVLLLLRASLQAPSKTAAGAGSSKNELLKTAAKSFDDALRVSQGKNMLALMGKARALFSLHKFPEALTAYQDVLQKMPDLVDPDPRIGIGCCFWQLGFKDDAKVAWERSLEINPESKVANILLGLYYLDSSGHVPVNSEEFLSLYKKAMVEYTQRSFKLGKEVPITCSTFANYFLSRKQWDNVDKLAHKAIHYTDVNAVASDGWYLLARKAHYQGDMEKATDFYRRADDARGGTETGYLPAKFGVAQLSVMKNDLGEAKLRLEKMIQQSKSQEAMILLGTIYAEEVFASQTSDIKEDKTAEMKKAVALLEGVRTAWKDPKKTLAPDASVLLNLARLYESDSPEKALQCLQQVEQLEVGQIPASDYPASAETDAERQVALRKLLPPQLLNNIGCFHYQSEKYELASDMFEVALGACMKTGEKDPSIDTDALVTTISFNLGRSYEARGLLDKAIEVYTGLLDRHDDYADARTRLAYIKLRKNPNKEGPDAVAKLYQDNPRDLEVRALYGWYLGKVHSRKRPANITEDPEFRHYKHTLQHHDKHDRYALVGMGNLYLFQAREMRRESESDKQKRSATYSKAVEFFEKALSLDPKNAYAAQGVAIALVEDRKDFKSALAIFNKVRDTVKEAHIYVNLGHIYAELKQFSKAIEHYEIALSKEGKANDPSILACLGRTWLNRGRADRDVDSYNKALECAKKALEVAPDQVHYQFNVAFVQIQLVTTIQALPENGRTVEQLEKAAEGLEAAIESLDAIAAHPQTPYPKHDVEQRANMARNTLRKQLERALGKQREWEEKNKEKILAAKEQREAELKRREAERQAILEKEKERQDKIRKEREAIAARDRLLAEQRAEEERARAEAELTTDSETGEKIKRKRKAAPRASQGEREAKPRRSAKKKKADHDADSEDEAAAAEAHTKKKRRLTKKENAKFKSAEIVVESDDERLNEHDDEDDDDALERAERNLEKAETPLSELDEELDAGEKMDVDEDREDRAGNTPGGGGGGEDEDEDEDALRVQHKRARRGRVVEESDDDEDAADAAEPAASKAKSGDEGDKSS
ncbi:Tetratricopeptide repeat protein 1 [Escovopsis weberi]|uniref:Tetratricopeptide repeat protein 1 n=1 Tax=Escovopsis weberi TaxID=150374 RepID=A0A0M9VT92_ESCWE|nr:Tetratricopeptide repeat protein 1 [Escovopsis weberi]